MNGTPTVLVIPRKDVARVGEIYNISPSAWVCISISSIVSRRDCKLEQFKDVLTLDFDDVITLLDDGGSFLDTPKRFTDRQAYTTLDFIELHQGTDFVVHCDAGLSRSVAIGAFMRDYYDYHAIFTQTNGDQFRNIWVYNRLRRAIMSQQENL